MVSFSLANRDIIPVFNALMALQTWLRPGLLAYVVGSNAEVIKPTAVRLQTERSALLDEAALKYPDVVGHDDGKGDGHRLIDDKAYRIGDPHPKAGQHVTADVNGQSVVLYKSKEAGAEFAARERELMGARSTFTVDERLTIDHVRKIDGERLAVSRAVAGMVATEMAVDFGSLSLLLNAPAAHDSNGVAVPAVVPGIPALVP